MAATVLVVEDERKLRDGPAAADDRLEAIEFAFQSDSAPRSLLMHLGVPIPRRGGQEAYATTWKTGFAATC